MVMDAPSNPKAALDEQKSQFVTAMSHEVRTPLSVILLSVRLLKNHGHQCSEEKKLEYLHHIEMAACQMNQLLNDQLVNLGADPAPPSLLDRVLPREKPPGDHPDQHLEDRLENRKVS